MDELDTSSSIIRMDEDDFESRHESEPEQYQNYHDQYQEHDPDTGFESNRDEHEAEEWSDAMRKDLSGTQITTKQISLPNRNAIKKKDGIMLKRIDIQYDILELVFKDDQKVFTSPETKNKLNFKDLYIECIAGSSRCTKVLKDKLVQDLEFTMAILKLALLVNIGRINTTLAFYPEMKTILRTFHSVPSLQKTESTRRHLQDAPRIKSILKGCVSSFDDPPSITLEAILAKRDREGLIPPTNVVNLGFVLFTCAQKVTEKHFYDDFDFNDLFYEPSISSISRYRAFMWLLYYYLEDPKTSNPWAEQDSTEPNRVPTLERLTPVEAAKENVDTAEELAYGEFMQEERKRIVVELASRDEKHLKKAVSNGNMGALTHSILAPSHKGRKAAWGISSDEDLQFTSLSKKKKTYKSSRKEIEFSDSDMDDDGEEGDYDDEDRLTPSTFVQLPHHKEPTIDKNEDPVLRTWKHIKDRDVFYDSDTDTDREVEYDNERIYNALNIASRKVGMVNSHYFATKSESVSGG